MKMKLDKLFFRILSVDHNMVDRVRRFSAAV